MKLKTVKVKTATGYKTINESDLTEEHELYGVESEMKDVTGEVVATKRRGRKK